MAELMFTVQPDENQINTMNSIWQNVTRGLKAGPVVVTLSREKRTPAQNRRLWAVLRDCSSQVEWHGRKLSDEDWKHIFSAAAEQQEAVPGINGGFVVLGVSTRQKPKEWFSDLFEIINAFGAEHGVRWSDPALEAFDYYINSRGAD